jgi:ferredoxin
MRIRVDYDKCVGHGVCEALDPDVFRVGDDAYTHLLIAEPDETHRAALADAVIECPTGALRIEG